MGAEFFETNMGRRFYEGTMMSIAESLEKMEKRKPEIRVLVSKGFLQEIKISGDVNFTVEEIGE